MGITLHWFLPTSGDSRNVVPGAGGHGRPPSIDYLAQITRAADDLGFDAVLTPTGTRREDAWLVTSALSQQTTRLPFLSKVFVDSASPFFRRSDVQNGLTTLFEYR